ncbi:hypothetical protein PAXRUDRAFT_462214 [Paxillus rubicundulus Ve08.2h10]|uniref:Uncharacterized protein n=1 Tax=Paxillus rubicundulus Ve08.2h10 TaxID=930991 RepID=A0A0D0DYJ1_9AGAM|nr:hypothetical protein PAXRUDRAFT_462214 [Paxillus rubicundulus Ve08.2h10]
MDYLLSPASDVSGFGRREQGKNTKRPYLTMGRWRCKVLSSAVARLDRGPEQQAPVSLSIYITATIRAFKSKVELIMI